METPYGEATQNPEEKGLVVASLRIAGAARLFESSRDLHFVAWRLRGKGLETLRHYVQELQAQNFMARLSPAWRNKILRLTSCADTILTTSERWLETGMPTHLWPLLWKEKLKVVPPIDPQESSISPSD